MAYPGRVAAPLIYGRMTRLGLQYGPAFRALQEAAVGDGEAFARVAVDADDASFAEHPFHPASLDACFQAAILAAGDVGATSTLQLTVLPVGIRRMEVYARPTRQCWVRARTTSRSRDHVEADLDIYGAAGQPVARVVGLRSRIAVTVAPDADGIFYRERWDERPHDTGPVEHRRILAVAFEPAAAGAVDEAFGDGNEVVWLGDPRRGAPGQWRFGEVAAARRGDEFDDLLVVASQASAASTDGRLVTQGDWELGTGRPEPPNWTGILAPARPGLGGSAADSLLGRHGDRRVPAPWNPRAVTFLASAADRWPHVAPTCLYPLLLRDPQLAVDAGSRDDPA